jgi:hypothetical protein
MSSIIYAVTYRINFWEKQADATAFLGRPAPS